MNAQNAVDQVTQMQTELEFLRSKTRSDEELISVLKNQCEIQAMEIAKMASDHAEELRKIRIRHDSAVRRETEITGILNTAAAGIVSGLRKMHGDGVPPKLPERKLQQIDDQRIGREEIGIDETLPAATLESLEPVVPPINQFPAPPPRQVRPRFNDEVDDGLRDIVQRLPQQATMR